MIRKDACQSAPCNDCHELPRRVHEQFTSSSQHVHEQFRTTARQWRSRRCGEYIGLPGHCLPFQRWPAKRQLISQRQHASQNKADARRNKAEKAMSWQARGRDRWERWSLPVSGIQHVVSSTANPKMTRGLIIFVYLSSLPVDHLSDAPRRRLVVTGIVQGYRAPPGSLTCSVYSTVTRYLGLKSHPKDNWPARESNRQTRVFKSSALNTELCGLVWPVWPGVGEAPFFIASPDSAWHLRIAQTRRVNAGSA